MIRNDIIRDEGIVYVGQWEPIYFVKQSGRNAENLQSSYDFQRSEPYVKHLASLGVNHMWGNFFKGYGLAFEDAEQQRLPEYIEACHKHGDVPGGTTADWTVESDHINPPTNADEVLAAVRDLLGGGEPK